MGLGLRRTTLQSKVESENILSTLYTYRLTIYLYHTGGSWSLNFRMGTLLQFGRRRYLHHDKIVHVITDALNRIHARIGSDEFSLPVETALRHVHYYRHPFHYVVNSQITNDTTMHIFTK